MGEILFICTGNYYRSRYAEILFNHYSDRYGLDWKAFSRGFQESTRPWPISPNARTGLKAKGIQLDQTRYPIKLSPDDMTSAYHIVLMDEIEHKPMIALEYPEWMEQVEFWQIRDVDFEAPRSALPKLDHQLNVLLRSLVLDRSTYWGINQTTA